MAVERSRHHVNNSLARSKLEPVTVPRPYTEDADRYGDQQHREAHRLLLDGYGQSLAETEVTRHRALERYIAGYPDAGRELSEDVHLRHGCRIVGRQIDVAEAGMPIHAHGRAGTEKFETSRALYEAATRVSSSPLKRTVLISLRLSAGGSCQCDLCERVGGQPTPLR